jgi:hypothetical protein
MQDSADCYADFSQIAKPLLANSDAYMPPRGCTSKLALPESVPNALLKSLETGSFESPE